jgi:nucleoside-diphosphate-sugar epimerase
MARFAARQWNIPTTIARLAVPYGDNGGLPAYHFQAMLAGQPVPAHPNKPNLYNLIHEDDFVAHIPGLLAAASVPGTIVNWGGSEVVSTEEWCAYMGDLTGVAPQLQYTDKMDGPLVLDLTRMHALVGPTKVHWRDGVRRMLQARYPNVPLK